MGTVREDLNVELTSFAITVATTINAIKHILPLITINGTEVGQIKGLGLVVGDPLEVTDKILHYMDGQLLVSTYLGGDKDDITNGAVWDHNAIG